MSPSTLIQPLERRSHEISHGAPAMAEWLLALGPVVHRLDYGGCVAAVGPADDCDVALLAAAHPLATLDVARAGSLPAATYDLVCFLGGLVDEPDPVGAAHDALRLVRPTGALVVVEQSRSAAFVAGPVTTGGWLLAAGAARVRIAAAAAHGYVLDARPAH
jgi:hypothetical protein